jgi:hypothetical protein
VQVEFDFDCSRVVVVGCFGILELGSEVHLIESVQIVGYSLEVVGFLEVGFFAELVFLVEAFPVVAEVLVVVLVLDLVLDLVLVVGVVVDFEGDLVVDDFVELGVVEVSEAYQTMNF